MSPDRARLAALPMYDFPELVAAHDALWSAIADRLERAGLDAVPHGLTRTEDLAEVWRDEHLLLGQTCGYPLMTTLKGLVQVVATPVYRALGCAGAFHRSAVMVAASDDVAHLRGLCGRRCVINGRDSNTGMNLLRAAIAPLADRSPFFESVIVSGSHRRSLEHVASGEADVAAIDAVTLEHLRRIDPMLVEATRVLAWSPPSPALPLVTATTTDAASIAVLRQTLAEIAADPALAAVRDTLLLDRFEILPIETYAEVLTFEREAIAMGYPCLA